MLLGKIWNTQVPVYFYSNISIWYSWYINAFVSPMCIEGVIGRCCMCHAWQVRQGSHVAMWHFHNQQEAPYEDLQHQVMPNRSVRPSLLPLRFWDIGGSIGENDHNIPKWYPQCKDSTTWIILHPASSCIILHHPVHLHPESSWIHARGFCDSYQDQCVGNGLCQGGLMRFDVGWQVPKALRRAKMRWEMLISAECVRLKKCCTQTY